MKLEYKVKNKKSREKEKSLINSVKSLLDSEINNLDLIGCSINNGFSSPSQSQIGALTWGQCRETANRHIKKLCSLGIIHKQYRHKKTCIYKISDLFYSSYVINELKGILNFLGGILFIFVTQLYLNSISINSPTVIPTLDGSQNSFFQEIVMSVNTESKLFPSTGDNKPTRSLFVDIINVIGDRLNLTDAAKIKLFGFNEDTLKLAYAELLRCSNIQDPYRLLFSLCYKCSKLTKDSYKKTLVQHALVHYGLSRDNSVYTTKTINDIRRENSIKREKYSSSPYGNQTPSRSARSSYARGNAPSCAYKEWQGNTDLINHKEDMKNRGAQEAQKIREASTPFKDPALTAIFASFGERIAKNNENLQE